MQDTGWNHDPPRETSRDIDLAAAGWAARYDRGPLSARDRETLDTWMAQDRRRAGAFARALAVGAAVDRGGAPCQDEPKVAAMSRRTFARAAAGIGAVALTGVGGYYLWHPVQRESTKRGGIRMVPLDDGSTATLNTDTSIAIAYDARFRKISLVRGEALFNVAKDATRPFLVETNGVVVRAVGTSFSVRAVGTGDVDIVMREGVVDVRRAADGATTRMGAHTRLTVADTGRLAVQTLSAEGVDRALAWKAGQIDLNNLTLEQAAREFARYSDRRITIGDSQIGGLKVTGMYAASDPDGFAESAALALGLVAVRDPDGTTLRSN